jgi:hypothetical protein
MPFSVKMTNLGNLGWVADGAGYSYQPLHPATGQPWPAIPNMVMEIWRKLSGYCATPLNFICPLLRKQVFVKIPMSNGFGRRTSSIPGKGLLAGSYDRSI